MATNGKVRTRRQLVADLIEGSFDVKGILYKTATEGVK